MFQLIVAVISIALVAALAIASIFYGGEAFSKSSEKAHVTALVNQAQQIAGAYQLYKTDAGVPPANIDLLVTGSYLSALPTPSKIATDGSAWALGTNAGGSAVATVPLKSAEPCAEVTRQAGGVSGATAQFTCNTAQDAFEFKL